MADDKKWDLVAISTIPLIMTLGNSMLIPALPAMERSLGVTSLQISMIITSYSAVAIIFIPIAGYLSDRFGRKMVILPSLAAAGIGGGISAAAPWFAGENLYPVIIAGRCLQGLGAAGAAPIVMPLVGDMFRSEKEVSASLGLIETSNTFGKVLSPILGSLLAIWSWVAVFWSVPALCLVSILLVAFLVRVPKKDVSEEAEKHQDHSFKAFLRSLKKIAKQEGRWLSAIFAIGAAVMLLLFALLFYLSNILEDIYGIDGVLKGAILAIPLLALCLSSYITGKRIGENKQKMKAVTVGGLALLTAALAGMVVLHPDPLWYLCLIIGIGGIGIGASLPCLDSLITEGISKEQRGTVSSVYSSMRFLGVAAGPPLMSLGMKLTTTAVFTAMGSLSLLAGLLALFAIKPKSGGGSGEKKKTTAIFKPGKINVRKPHMG